MVIATDNGMYMEEGNEAPVEPMVGKTGTQ